MTELRASGGICAPSYIYGTLYGSQMKRGDIFYITYQVQGRLRRWWLRRHGWSTEWTVEHEYVPITDALPSFTATRGGLVYR